MVLLLGAFGHSPPVPVVPRRWAGPPGGLVILSDPFCFTAVLAHAQLREPEILGYRHA
jgi:hypothetical protein